MNPEKMDDATRTELMNAEIDGVATEAQRAALAQLLQWDPSAREELEALRAVADLLGRTRAPQPPENFAEGVMTMVRRVRETGWIGRLKAALTRAGWSWGSQPEDSINLSPGHGYVSAGVGAPKRSREDVMARQQNMFQRRMIFAGAGVLAVAALVVYFGGYYPPAKEEAFGTIGAAERYRSSQITGADVKLDSPELQAFLQSETFDRIVRDPAARQALSNADLQAAFMNDKFKDAMNLSVRYGNDAIVKMRQDANLLSQQAADIQAKLNQGVNLASLDAAISKFRSDAAGLEGKVREGVTPTYLKDAIQKFTSDAAGLEGKVRDGVSVEYVKDAVVKMRQDVASLQVKFNDAQVSRLADASQKLNADAAMLNSKGGPQAIALAKELTRLSGDAAGLEGKVRDGQSVNYVKDAAGLEGKVRDGQTVNYVKDAIGKLQRDANSLQVQFNYDAASLRNLNATLAQMRNDAILNDAIVKFGSQAAGLEGKVRDGVSVEFVKDAVSKLNGSATEMAKVVRGFEANSLKDAISRLDTQAASLQKLAAGQADAAQLRGGAADLRAQAVSFQKQVNLFGDAAKLDALGLDAKGMSALGQLARSGALYQAINQHEASLQGRRDQ